MFCDDPDSFKMSENDSQNEYDESNNKETSTQIHTAEEMRMKRLAFFDKGQSQTKEWKIERPSGHTQQDVVNVNEENYLRNDRIISGERLNYQPQLSTSQGGIHNSSSSSKANPQVERNIPVTPTHSSEILNHSQMQRRNSDLTENGPVPLRSKRGPTGISRSSALSSSMDQLSLEDSGRFSVFKSQPDLDDLGLSTHRPDSETSARSIPGEIYIPSIQGSGKTPKQIFSHKTREELHSALGDKKMEELMNKVTHDIGELKGRNQSQNLSEHQGYQNIQNVAHAEEGQRRDYANSKLEHVSPRRHSLSQDASNTKDYRSLLVQNHDQVMLPKSARNSFSSEEIYRQAYGDGMMYERQYNRGLSNSSTASNYSYKPPEQQSQNDGQYALNSSRSSLMEHPGQMPIRHPLQQQQGYPNPYSYPPPSIPPSPFDNQNHHPRHPFQHNQSPHSTTVPMSPQSSYSGSSFPYFMHQPPPPYSSHNQNNPHLPQSYHPNQPHPYFHDPNMPSQYGHMYGMAQNQGRAAPTSQAQSVVNSSLSAYSPPFSSAHYGPSRISAHPGINAATSLEHQAAKNNAYQYSQPSHGVNQSFDSSLSHSGHGLKMPHPPANPPALQGKEDLQSSKTKSLEHRSSLNNFSQNQNRNGDRPSSARANATRGTSVPNYQGGSNTNNNNNNNNNGYNGNNAAARQRPSSADYERRKPVYSNTRNMTRPSSAKVRTEMNANNNNNNNNNMSSSPVPPPKRNNYLSPSPAQAKRESSPVIKQRIGNRNLSSPNLNANNNSSDDNSTVSASSCPPGQGDDSLHILCPEFHRLPPDQEEQTETADKMHAIAKSGYVRFHELTPRIQDGDMSLWQCLPDEVWLYVLTFLSQNDLGHLMSVSKGFYRLANDQSLWRYITVRPHFNLTDATMNSIMTHHPISLAMVKCQGHELSTNALEDFFRETQGRLKELNICGCSHGALVGSVVLETASKFCQSLTHLDASFSNINDDSFTAIVSSCDRLESVCINGFQSMTDSTLLTLVKKHGTSLRTLELYACFSLSATVLRNLGEYCHDLRRLCLGGCNKLTASTMITLSTNLARVEELDLRGCRNLKNECIRKIVRNCPRIQTLVLANCQQISNPALVEMGTYLKNTLRIVDVCGCDQVGDEGVVSLVKNCDRLTSLDISSTGCMHSSLSAIATSGCGRWIETLKLSFLSGISEANLSNLLRHCPRLKLIHTFGCSSLRNLTRLRDMKPGVTIEGDVEVPRLSIL